MYYLASWSIVLLLLGLWSAFMWLATAVIDWSLQTAGGLQAGSLVVPAAIQAWLPPEMQEALAALTSSLVGLFDFALSTFPALATAVTVLGWLVWGLGAAFLLALGIAIHVGIWFWRRQRQQPMAGVPSWASR